MFKNLHKFPFFNLKRLNFKILYSDFETYNEAYGVDAAEAYRFKIGSSLASIIC